jgi:hypothetical protein
MESLKAGFPLFPHSLEIPSGFPHYHGLHGGLGVYCLSGCFSKPQGVVFQSFRGVKV